MGVAARAGQYAVGEIGREHKGNMLELVLRRYFWVFNLLVLTMAAFLIARSVNAYVEAALMPAPTAGVDLPKPAPGKRATTADKSNATINSRNLFNSEAAPPESAPAGLDGPVAGPTAYCEDAASKSAVSLVGVATSSDPDMAMASVRIDGELRHGFLNDNVGDYTITEVHTHWICLKHGTNVEYANLFDPAEGARPTPGPASPGPMPTARPGDESDKFIAKTGPNEWAIDGGFLNDQIKNPAKLMSMGRAVPHLKDGKTDGFKLYAIRPSGLYYKLGVRNGDVIRTVNGTPLDSLDKALSLFNTLMESRDITLGVERRGAPMNLRYTIR